MTTHTLFFKHGLNQLLRRLARGAELEFSTSSPIQYQSPILTDSAKGNSLILYLGEKKETKPTLSYSFPCFLLCRRVDGCSWTRLMWGSTAPHFHLLLFNCLPSFSNTDLMDRHGPKVYPTDKASEVTELMLGEAGELHCWEGLCYQVGQRVVSIKDQRAATGEDENTTSRELLQPSFHSVSFRSTKLMLVARW